MTEREEFECFINDKQCEISLVKNQSGEYVLSYVQLMFEAWQASRLKAEARIFKTVSNGLKSAEKSDQV